jgi:hypothetical protein
MFFVSLDTEKRLDKIRSIAALTNMTSRKFTDVDFVRHNLQHLATALKRARWLWDVPRDDFPLR